MWYILVNSNWDKISDSLRKRNQYLELTATLFEAKKNCRPNPLIQIFVHRSNIHYSKVYQKENWKNNTKFPLERKKIWSPRYLVQLSIWNYGLGVLRYWYSIKLSRNLMDSKIMNLTNALWKGLMLDLLTLKLNSNQCLYLFGQKQINGR